jgi:hypothetical protein
MVVVYNKQSLKRMDSKISWADIPMDDEEQDDGFTKVESKKTKKKNKKKKKKKTPTPTDPSKKEFEPKVSSSVVPVSELESLLADWTRLAYQLTQTQSKSVWESLELTEDEWDDILGMLPGVVFKTSSSVQTPPKDNWAQVLDKLPIRPPKRLLIQKFIQNTKAFQTRFEENEYEDHYYDDDDGYFSKDQLQEEAEQEPKLQEEEEEVEEDDDGYFVKPEEDTEEEEEVVVQEKQEQEVPQEKETVPKDNEKEEEDLEPRIREDHPVYQLIKQDSRCLSLFNELTRVEQAYLVVSFKRVWDNFHSNPNSIVKPIERHIESLYYLVGSIQELDLVGNPSLHFKSLFINTVNWLKSNILK